MIALVTGMSGFVGRHLAALLEADGQTVAPLVLDGRRVDLRDAPAVEAAVAAIQPDRVYHLAAISGVGRSWQDPEEVRAVNEGGAINLLAALVRHAPAARVLLASTGAVYGPPRPDGRPFAEDDPPWPQNPYAISKLEAEAIAADFVRRHGLDVRIARPLGHAGPGQRLGFVVPDLASQAAAIKSERARPRIMVGSLAPRREFADVRDVVRAYRLILDAGDPGRIYNLATNRPRSIREVAEEILRAAGVEAELVQDPGRVRPADESSPALAKDRIQALGFDYRIGFEQTIADVVAEWMDKDGP